MKYLLDTCTISYFFRKDLIVIENMKSKSPTSMAISVITFHEIEYGLILEPKREKKLRSVFEALLNQVTIINLDQEIAKTASKIRANLKQSGNMIGSYDVLIAATAIQHKLICITSNTKEFNRVAGLAIEDWKKI